MKKLLQRTKLFKIGDILFIILFTCLIIFSISNYWDAPVGQYLKIEKNNDEPKILSLNQNSNEKISGLLGDSEINISEGKARFSKSPCTKKYCIHQGWVNRVNQTVVCLPNQISISITDGNEPFDSVNY